MGEAYDKIIIGDKEYDFVKGVTNFKNKMISYFPEEEKAIRQPEAGHLGHPPRST